MKFVIFFCKACSCCTASTSVAKPALNEYILVALITDLDKKKRKKQTQCKELYIYKTTTTIFFFVYCEMHEIQ